MNLKELIKSIPPNLKKKGNAFISDVRELEEEKPNHFIAFVDDNDDSWDVQIVLDPKTSEVLSHNCDCFSKLSICAHKVAVLQSMMTSSKVINKSRVLKKLKKRKKSKGELLIEGIETEDLLEWIVSELDENPRLVIKFENRFINNAETITPEQIQEQYKASLKAILGRRKTAELSEVAKVLNLMSTFHTNVINVAIPSMDKKESFYVLLEILKVCNQLYQSGKKHTTRISTYKQKLIEKILLHFPLLQPIQKTNFLENLIVSEAYRHFGTTNILSLLKIASKDIDKKKLIDFSRYFIVEIINSHLTSEKAKLETLQYTIDGNIFLETQELFEIRLYQNDYNIALLLHLLKLKEYNYIISSCEYILNVYHIAYKGPYFNILFKTLVAKGDLPQAKTALELAFFELPTLDRFKKLIELRENDSEIEAFFNKVNKLHLSPGTSKYKDVLAIKFYLWNLQEEYLKIRSKIKDSPSFRAALPYQDKLIEENRIQYFVSLANSFSFSWGGIPKDCVENFQYLMQEVYSEAEIRNVHRGIRLNHTLNRIFQDYYDGLKPSK